MTTFDSIALSHPAVGAVVASLSGRRFHRAAVDRMPPTAVAAGAEVDIGVVLMPVESTAVESMSVDVSR